MQDASQEITRRIKTVNLITKERVETILFPDGQPHIRVFDINPGDWVRVVCPIRSSLELVQLLMVSNALANIGVVRHELVIPYLMGARYDRVMKAGDSFDLRVVANAINSCSFVSVNLFDVHSSFSTKLIHNSRSHDNRILVKAYSHPDSVLIVPDKGAVEKAALYSVWNANLVDYVHCEKERDLNDKGRVTLKVLDPGRCAGRRCVIIDDICDGGATFIAIAEQINPEHLTLIVSHGIFSKGFQKLREHFDEIITTDSYALHASDKVTTIPLNL